MGKYDDILVGFQQKQGGKYDDIISDFSKKDDPIKKMAMSLGDYYEAGAEKPVEQRLLENTLAATSGATLPGAVSSVVSGVKKLAEKSPFIKGLIKSPRALSPEFDAGKAASGISQNLPERLGRRPRFPEPELQVATKQPRPIVKAETLPSVPPVTYPKDPNAFLNFARARVSAFGKRLSPQELNDYKGILGEMFRKGEIVPGTDSYAIATKLGKEVTPLHNAAIQGREALNKAYGVSKTIRMQGPREAVAALIKQYGKKAIEGLVLGGVGAYAAKKVFQP